jgi:hypothetical protein
MRAESRASSSSMVRNSPCDDSSGWIVFTTTIFSKFIGPRIRAR